MSSTTSPLKKAGTLAVGTILAVAGHFVGEYMSTTCHEFGHAGAYKLITGRPGEITLEKGPHFLMPYKGSCFMRGLYGLKSTSQMAVTAAGPLAGIGATAAQLYVLHAVENKLAPQKPLEPAQQLPLIGYFKELYQETYAATTTYLQDGKAPDFEASPLLIACKMLKFLRYSRIIGESLYGFLPIATPPGVGDGQKMWALLLNRDEHHTLLTKHLFAATSIIMLSPIILGATQAFMHRTLPPARA